MLQTQPLVRAKGIPIPALGLGTWQIKGDECSEIVEEALHLGYRHIDTAQAYNNEEFVGRGIRRARVKRENIFLTTKVWKDNFSPTKLKSSVKTSLDKLETDHVDLLLLHWPSFEDSTMEETLDALMEVKEEKMALQIGVSNFNRSQLEKAYEHTKGAILVNQVEYHPFLNQDTILDFLREHDMALTAYSPLAQGGVFESDTLKEIARTHEVEAAEIALAWLVHQQQVVAIPRTSSKDHLKSNFRALEVELSNDEMNKIDQLRSENKRIVDPSFAPNWD